MVGRAAAIIISGEVFLDFAISFKKLATVYEFRCMQVHMRVDQVEQVQHGYNRVGVIKTFTLVLYL